MKVMQTVGKHYFLGSLSAEYFITV